MNAFATLAATVIQSAPVAKTAQAKPQTAAKTKTAAPKTAALAIPFALHPVGGRPGSGANLFAFTHAWLSLSGMASGKAYPTKQARQVAGDTAIGYHTRTGNFKNEGGMLSLTPKGQIHFGKNRANSEKTVQAFVDVLKSGKVNPDIGIKNADYIYPVKAA